MTNTPPPKTARPKSFMTSNGIIADDVATALAQLPCRGCGKNRLRVLGYIVDDGPKRLYVVCDACGTEHEVVAQDNYQTFQWIGDNNAHEIWWNITGIQMWQKEARENGVEVMPLIELPAKLVKWMVETNDYAEQEHAYAMSTDETVPVLSVQHPSCVWEHAGFPPIYPIDGWHRLYKAAQLGKGIKTYLLDRAGERAFRLKDIIYNEGPWKVVPPVRLIDQTHPDFEKQNGWRDEE